MSEQAIIIGIDPGYVTGTFVYSTWDGLKDFGHSPREQIALDTHDCFGRWVALYGAHNIHIAIERYLITTRTAKLSQQPDALEVTGLIKGLAQIHGITDVRQYMKSNLKFASDKTLRTCGWAHPGYRHANDAARQAFALLKDVDYPLWCRVSEGAMIESDDR